MGLPHPDRHARRVREPRRPAGAARGARSPNCPAEGTAPQVGSAARALLSIASSNLRCALDRRVAASSSSPIRLLAAVRRWTAKPVREGTGVPLGITQGWVHSPAFSPRSLESGVPRRFRHATPPERGGGGVWRARLGQMTESALAQAVRGWGSASLPDRVRAARRRSTARGPPQALPGPPASTGSRPCLPRDNAHGRPPSHPPSWR